MNITLPQFLIGATGAILIYAAVKNVNPVDVVKNALSGKGTYAEGEQQPIWETKPDGTIGLGPAFGKPYTETPVPEGGLLGLPPVPGAALNDEGFRPNFAIPVTSTVWRDPTLGRA